LTRVLILTESAVTRAGLEALLAAYPEIEIAGAEDDADVLVTETMERLNTDLPVVLLTDDLPNRVILRSGVRAMLPRDAPPAQIAAAIQAAAAGLVAVPAAETLPLLPLAPEDGQPDRLTPREIEVLEMLAEGVSNKMIAFRLSISEHTAKYHVNSILAKLNAGTRTEAVMRGVRLGLVKL
jgi:DNA-binding NarL/FixJ family response regulator